jgi:integrase
MPRKAKGEIIERPGKRGTAFVLRFSAYGKRRHLTVGNTATGYTRAAAEEELAFVMAQVKRGAWRPPDPAPKVEEPAPEPTFHEFASAWFARHRGEWRQRTIEDYEIALSNHLIPFFRDHRLSQITFEEVGRYVGSKVRERTDKLVERPLSNGSINTTLARLGQVLDEAVLYGQVATHPLATRAGRRALRVKADKPRRASLDARQAAALLEVAGRHRTLIATALMAGGLRVSELTHLRWRDAKLASARLHVTDSKTDAGVRVVDVEPDLLDVLKEHKARSRWSAPSDFVFPGKRRRVPRDRHAITRLLGRIVERANTQLVEDGWDPIPGAVTFHSLRRTYATLMAEAGASPAFTMRQIGHSKAAFTLEVYTDVNVRREAGPDRIGALLRACEVAHNGANGDSGAPSESSAPDAGAPNPAESSAF